MQQDNWFFQRASRNLALRHKWKACFAQWCIMRGECGENNRLTTLLHREGTMVLIKVVLSGITLVMRGSPFIVSH